MHERKQYANPSAETLKDLEVAFPVVEPWVQPAGARILVQLRTVRKMSAGGIHLPEDVRNADKWNTATAKVIALGPLAFCHRDSGKPWSEGVWCSPGDFTRVPRYGGDRWEQPRVEGASSAEDLINFVVVNDHEILGIIDPNHVLKLRAYA